MKNPFKAIQEAAEQTKLEERKRDLISMVAGVRKETGLVPTHLVEELRQIALKRNEYDPLKRDGVPKHAKKFSGSYDETRDVMYAYGFNGRRRKDMRRFTVAYQRHGNNFVFSVAFCHPDDNFKKKAGRREALRKLSTTGGHRARIQQYQSVIEAVCYILESLAVMDSLNFGVHELLSTPYGVRSFRPTPKKR